MKFYEIILFASIILSIYSDLCGIAINPDSRKDCDKLEKTTSFPYCCFIKGKDAEKNEVKNCSPISQNDYDNIKEYKKTLEKLGGSIKKIDCKSIYLELSILSFIFLLL